LTRIAIENYLHFETYEVGCMGSEELCLDLDEKAESPANAGHTDMDGTIAIATAHEGRRWKMLLNSSAISSPAIPTAKPWKWVCM
jgi:hypothetical protein